MSICLYKQAMRSLICYLEMPVYLCFPEIVEAECLYTSIAETLDIDICVYVCVL